MKLFYDAAASCLLLVISFLFIANSGQPILADAIYLKNGSTIEGKIVSEDQQSVTVEIGFGTITIERSQIYQVIAEEWKPPKPPKIAEPSLPEKSITTTTTVTPTKTSVSAIYSLLDAKARTPPQKEINKLLIQLIELPESSEPRQLLDELVAKSEKETDYLLLLLTETEDIGVLKWVIEALGRHRVVPAVKYLLKILEGENAESLKIAVLDALGQIKDESTIHLIRNQLPKEKSPVVKTAIINHLFIAEDKESLPLLVDYLDDENSDVRKASTNAIISIAQKATADELTGFNLINSLKSKVVEAKHKETRQEIINIFGQLKSSEALETLMNFLLDENAEIRSESAMALGRIGDKKTTEFLIERLQKEQDTWTKMQIIGALQGTNDSTAIPALIEALRDAEEKVRLCAARALRNITPYAFGEEYEKWKEWWEKEQKK